MEVTSERYPSIHVIRRGILVNVLVQGCLHRSGSQSIHATLGVTGLDHSGIADHQGAAGSQFNAFVDPAERYLIVSLAGHPENLGQVDYWISFRNADDTWRGPVNLGPRVNGQGREGWSPYVSPDGRWFFFMSSATTTPTEPLTTESLRAIHEAPGNGLGHVWILDAAFLDELAEAAHD